MTEPIFRRNFLTLASALPLAAQAQTHPPSVREFLEKLTYKRDDVSIFLDSRQQNWAKFDPELGYLLQDGVLLDGVDGSRTVLSFGKAGERTMVNYAGRPCRINTYGDSFTQGHQVSDGETWQEYLAAHLGEPVRNFGIGGYGVYQACRRMVREEATPAASEYLVLNIYGLDDHLRSVDAWRWLRFGEYWRTRPEHRHMFHGNPWAHVRLDLATGKLVELPNLCPTPESLYQLCDKDYVYEHFRDDLIVKLLVAQRKGAGVSLEQIEGMAERLNVRPDFSSPDAAAETARAVHVEYALRAGIQIVEKAQAFARENRKKLLVLLSYDSGTVRRACEGLPRPDPSLVGFLRDSGIPFVDALAKHVEDFRSFRLTPQEYISRYFIGHYKPVGNHFFAFAVKDAIAGWLDPKPVAYRRGSETIRP
jgi:hypothetical protein